MDEPDFDLEGVEKEVLKVGCFESLPELDEDVWLLGVVLANHSVSVFGFKNVMRELWQTRNCLEIRHAGQKIFTFKFTSPKDRDLVLKSGPWCFERHLLALNTYDGKSDPRSVELSMVPFWIQVQGLPVAGRTESIARSIGNAFAGFIDWDKSEASKYGSFFRLRAWVQVDVPLRRGQMIEPEKGDPIKLRFKFEKLINFCYRCGRMDHVQKECGYEIQKGGFPFGPWLRAEGNKLLVPRWRPGGGQSRDSRGEGCSGEGEVEGGGTGEDESGVGDGSGESGDGGDGGVSGEGVRDEGKRSEEGGGSSGAVTEENKKGEGERGKGKDSGKLVIGGGSSRGGHGNKHEKDEFKFTSPHHRGQRGGGRRGGTRGGYPRMAGGDREVLDKEKVIRKRSCSSSPSGSGTGFTPPLKKVVSDNVSDNGLGSAAAAVQPRPPQ
ncbi:uncharacterized protein LOC130748067 [Lotus japonicus]|uniref:uncharacterized protein LOC130748067 n=1 Tax=Lotus japonicus TaxID=34305 RepID=UPI002589B3FF|nr:uncharacterized protein LOC130748067 [Lotus japonicus]